MTGDESQEMDHGRRTTMDFLPFYEDIEAIRSYTFREITHFDFNLRCYNPAPISRYTMYCRRCGSSGYDTDLYSEH